MNLRTAFLIACTALGLNFAIPSQAEARDFHRHYRGSDRYSHSYRHYPRYRHHSSSRYHSRYHSPRYRYSRNYYSSQPRVIYRQPRYYDYDHSPRYRTYHRPRGYISFSFGGSHW